MATPDAPPPSTQSPFTVPLAGGQAPARRMAVAPEANQESYIIGCILERKDRPVGRLLLEEARRYHRQYKTNYAFTRTLIDQEYATDGEIAQWLADFYKTKVVSGAELIPKGDIRSQLSASLARQRCALPLEIDRRNRKVKIAVFDPEIPGFNQIRHAFDSFEIQYVIALHGDLTEAINRCYIQRITASADNELEKVVEGMIREAAASKVSDIHFIPEGAFAKILFRQHGEMIPWRTMPADLKDRMTTQIKLATMRGPDGRGPRSDGAGGVMDVSKNIIPQDANAIRSYGSSDYTLRFSTLPVLHGESIVIRVLDQNAQVLSLAELGMLSDMAACMTREVAKPQGLIAVIAPTGNGKSTTLASAIKLLDPNARTIFSVEDPVEYRLRGVRQTPVTPQVTFASALRAILRQDPEVILVGEMRDEETAEIAINAANTGHLIPTTLHANGAILGINRLFSLKINPQMVNATLSLLLAQRLVRRLCSKCKQPHKDNEALLAKYKNILDIAEKADVFAERGGLPPKFFEPGSGCPDCDGSGYGHQLCLTEAREICDELKEFITNSDEGKNFNARAAEAHFKARFDAGEFLARNMREDGIVKAALGWTTVEQVLANTI